MLLVLMGLLVNLKPHGYVTYVRMCLHWLALLQVTEWS